MRLARTARSLPLTALLLGALLATLSSCSDSPKQGPRPGRDASGAAERVVGIDRFLADPAAIASGRLEIVEEWFTDMVPPGGGTRRATLAVDAAGELERSSSVRSPPGPPQESRLDLGRGEALELLGTCLRELEAGGCLALPEEVPPREDVFYFAGSSFTLTLELRGAGDVARFTTRLPPGAEGLPSVSGALDAVLSVRERLSR